MVAVRVRDDDTGAIEGVADRLGNERIGRQIYRLAAQRAPDIEQ